MNATEIALKYLHEAEKEIFLECPPPYEYPSDNGRAAFIINYAISALLTNKNTGK